MLFDRLLVVESNLEGDDKSTVVWYFYKAGERWNLEAVTYTGRLRDYQPFQFACIQA